MNDDEDNIIRGLFSKKDAGVTSVEVTETTYLKELKEKADSFSKLPHVIIALDETDEYVAFRVMSNLRGIDQRDSTVGVSRANP